MRIEAGGFHEGVFCAFFPNFAPTFVRGSLRQQPFASECLYAEHKITSVETESAVPAPRSRRSTGCSALHYSTGYGGNTFCFEAHREDTRTHRRQDRVDRLKIGMRRSINEAGDESEETPKILFDRTAKEPKGKGHKSYPRCTFVDKDRSRGELRIGRIACHGGICLMACIDRMSGENTDSAIRRESLRYLGSLGNRETHK